MCTHSEWTHIAVVYETTDDPKETDWGRDAKNRFVSTLEASGGQVLLQIEVSEDASRVNAYDVLRKLRDGNARIVFLAVGGNVQQEIFHAVYQSRDDLRMYGPGHAYLSSWISDTAWRNDGSVNATAFNGAKGLLGLAPGITLNASSTQRAYKALWGGEGVASAAGCQSYGPPYCDADGDMQTQAEYGSQRVDALLLFAKGMDALLRKGGDKHDSDALYAEILALSPFEGVGGTVRLGANGDALTNIPLVNLHERQGSSGQASVATEPVLTVVGEFDLMSARLDVGGRLLYSGLDTVTPSSTSRLDADQLFRNILIAILSFVFVLVIIAALYLIWWWRKNVLKPRQERKQLKEKQIEAVEDAVESKNKHLETDWKEYYTNLYNEALQRVGTNPSEEDKQIAEKGRRRGTRPLDTT